MAEIETKEENGKDNLPVLAEVGYLPALSLVIQPNEVMKDAHFVAVQCKQVIDAKPKKIIINGKRYLEIDDWQLFGSPYGIVAKVKQETVARFERPGGIYGYTAGASAILIKNGMEISYAEAMCMSDEKNWKGKPEFTLKSMAQTRACAKALRMVLSWVVVLAGYAPTPAEEMPQEEMIESEKPKQPSMIERFLSYAKSAKERIGEKEYYRILSEELGVEHANELKEKKLWTKFREAVEEYLTAQAKEKAVIEKPDKTTDFITKAREESGLFDEAISKTIKNERRELGL